MQGDYAVYIRDKEGTLVNRINDYVNMHILMTLNDPGSWSISSVTVEKCPFEEGNGIIVVRNGKFLYGGILTDISDDFDASTSLHNWQVQGKGDLEYLNRRYCHVDPVNGTTDQISHYTASGMLGDVVRDLIRLNLGTGAMVNRREPIVKDYIQSIGPNVSVSLRFQNLWKTTHAITYGNEWNIRPNWDKDENKIYFEVFQGQDLTEKYVFSDEFSNILSAEHLISVPEGNSILVGGRGQMTEREFASAQSDNSISKWGLIEVFQDGRNQDDADEYASSVLASKTADCVGYSCVASNDDLTPQFGSDFGLGDFVGMKVFDQFVTVEVQQCEINVEGGIETIEPRFGTVASGKLKNIFKQLSDLRSDVDELLGTEVE